MRWRPKLRALARQAKARCCGSACSTAFGQLDGWRTRSPARRSGGRLDRDGRRRESRATTISPRRSEVREHLFAGDFYQANLTFGCDVRLLGHAAGCLCAASPPVAGRVGRDRSPSGRLAAVAEPRAILHDSRPDDRGQADERHGAPRRADPDAGPGRDRRSRGRPQAAGRESDDRRLAAQRSGARRRAGHGRGARAVRGRDLSDASTRWSAG